MLDIHKRHGIIKKENTFHAGYFIAGIIFGPLAILICLMDGAPKGSSKSSIIGWFGGWGVLIGCFLLLNSYKIILRELEAEKMHKAAIEQAAHQQRVFEQEVAWKKEFEAKKKSVSVFNEKCKQICTIKERINDILYGRVYDGFNKDSIRSFLPSGTLIRDEDLNEQIVSRDVTCANTSEEIGIANSRVDMILNRVEKRINDIENIYQQFKWNQQEEEVKKVFQRATEEAKKKEVQQVISSPFAEIERAMGSKKEIEKIAKPMTCPYCNGKRYVTEEIVCEKCDGVGTITSRSSITGFDGRPLPSRTRKCGGCRGKGNVGKRVKCKECKGKGKIIP